MTILNIVAMLFLSPGIAKMTKYYLNENHINDVDNTPIPLRTEV